MFTLHWNAPESLSYGQQDDRLRDVQCVELNGLNASNQRDAQIYELKLATVSRVLIHKSLTLAENDQVKILVAAQHPQCIAAAGSQTYEA
jgi:hypothetical protein